MKRRSLLLSSGIGITALTGCVSSGSRNSGGNDHSERTETQTPPPLSSDNEAYQGRFTARGPWTTHCFDAGRGSYNPDTDPPTGQVGVAWLRTPIENSRTFRTTPPVTDDSRVYVGSEASEYGETELRGGMVAAFDGESGRQIWRTMTDSETVEGIVYADELILARCETYSDPPSATLLALTAANGSEQWRVDLPLGQLNDPVVMDGRAYITSSQGGLTAVALDGTRLWERPVGVAADEYASTPPCVGESSVFVGTDQGRIIAFDAESGHQQWSSEVVERGHRPRVQNIPTVVDNTLFVTGVDYRLHAIRTGDGTERWSTRLLDQDYGNSLPSVAVAGQNVYSNTLNGGLIALQRSDGSERWRSGESGGDRPPAIAGELIIAPTFNGVQAYTLDGEPRWKFEASPFGAPGTAAYIMDSEIALTHDQAYMSLHDGRLFCLGAA